MDLSTIRAKLEDGQYKDRNAFADDVRLIASNANLYNQAGSSISKTTEKFLAWFEKREYPFSYFFRCC